VSQLFAEGDYRPLHIGGRRARHLVGYTRSFGSICLCVVVPRLASALLAEGRIIFAPEVWADTSLEFDRSLGCDLIDIFTGRVVAAKTASIPISQLLQTLPVAVFVSRS
jgi:(1->4)-alpha-D-glucan 1-alpha-D-glucosylmutase